MTWSFDVKTKEKPKDEFGIVCIYNSVFRVDFLFFKFCLKAY